MTTSLNTPPRRSNHHALDRCRIEPLESRFLCSAADLTGTAPVKEDLVPTGRNRYLILEPGHVLRLDGQEDGQHVRVVITVTPKTKRVDGALTRVVRETETVDGELVEISRNFLAIDPQTRDVYYFGEDVDIYENGKVVSHDGQWQSGVDGALFGLLMPGKPKVGMTFLQENAPGVALDQGEVIATHATFTTPAGTFHNVLKVKEATALEPGNASFKYYAPGVGLLEDAPTRLTKYTR